ncbi:LLM class flavin-dependent oxidoreductase [Actinospica robiniae]|uniref:LLM class flavin-dependent oxidoreductase n=1 Tax=Actinospica robiniae TaxID=304901 RepID=UPI000412DAF5|nr:LLM class flavin-dependent oxidoreductase [Actinospica robiniae]
MGDQMRYGVVLPGGDATEQLELAVLAEKAGWDGVFVWEGVYGIDAWGLLCAMAVRTNRVRLGTLLTPLPWRRPWKVASQAATLDQLSHGRAILAVGLGAYPDMVMGTEEVSDRRERAERLDEGIDLIRTLWSGGRTYHGRHFDFDATERGELVDLARPVQEKLPIWVVGRWPRPKSMRRAARCDGVIPEYSPPDVPATSQDRRELRAWLAEHGAAPDIDMVAEGQTRGDDPEAARYVAGHGEDGCTWWLEVRWEGTEEGSPLELIRERIAAGPPREQR